MESKLTPIVRKYRWKVFITWIGSDIMKWERGYRFLSFHGNKFSQVVTLLFLIKASNTWEQKLFVNDSSQKSIKQGHLLRCSYKKNTLLIFLPPFSSGIHNHLRQSSSSFNDICGNLQHKKSRGFNYDSGRCFSRFC